MDVIGAMARCPVCGLEVLEFELEVHVNQVRTLALAAIHILGGGRAACV